MEISVYLYDYMHKSWLELINCLLPQLYRYLLHSDNMSIIEVQVSFQDDDLFGRVFCKHQAVPCSPVMRAAATNF